MFRYLMLLWNDDSPAQTSEATRLSSAILTQRSAWSCVFTAAGVQVFCTPRTQGPSLVQPLANAGGVVLENLFDRHTDPREPSAAGPTRLDEQQSARMVSTHGRVLMTQCWGNYVAVVHDAASLTTHIVKDPCGDLPCLFSKIGNVGVVCSDINDFVSAGENTAVNDHYVHDRLGSGGSSQRALPLQGIDVVHRGQCLTVRRRDQHVHMTKQLYWEPQQFADAEDPIEDPQHAASGMHGVILSCTRSLAAGHASVLARLSGGLDSSIVVGCLAKASASLTAYTYWDQQGRADERPWARLAAERAHCAHVECALDAAHPSLRDMPPLNRSLYPPSRLGYLHRAAIENQLSMDAGATAIFTGSGGDAGFCSHSNAHALIEHLRRHGLSRHTLRIASQVALSSELSTWQVVWRSLRRWRRGPRMQDERKNFFERSVLVSPELIDAQMTSETFPHPWFTSGPQVPWSTVYRLGALLYPNDYYNLTMSPDADAAVYISPLYAQPVVEFMLRVPLYTHFEGGRDRGLARRAFADEVPAPILNRLWKDRAPGFHERLLELNRDYLREVLLDGLLVRRGLLVRATLEQALNGMPNKVNVYPGEILQHLDTELWLRQWSDV